MRSRPKGPLSSLLRVPLFYKIMVANVAIVIGVSVVGATVAGIIAVVVANALILKLALVPLHELEDAAAAVQAGDLTRRTEPSVLADREMERLIDTFNSMLDNLAESRKKQRDLSIRALNAAEEERKRVAADLHDKTAQTLAGLLVQLSVAKSTKDPDARAEKLKIASEQAAAAMDEVYRVVQVLRPPALELLGLRGAIETYVRSLAEETSIEIEMRAEDVRDVLAPEAEIATYRILQEALSNVVRHSQATQAIVHIQRAADGVQISIDDNGVGFASQEVLRSARSLGLFGMQERASYLGGHVEIHSGKGGTRVDVQIPTTEDINHG